jgi:hypothetical protein
MNIPLSFRPEKAALLFYIGWGRRFLQHDLHPFFGVFSKPSFSKIRG